MYQILCMGGVSETHPLQQDCWIRLKESGLDLESDDAQLQAFDPLGRAVDYSTAYQSGWQVLDIRWYNYWTRNL